MRIKRWRDTRPDLLLLIDGGLGQISQVHEELETLGFSDSLMLVGVACGPDRKAGQVKALCRVRHRRAAHSRGAFARIPADEQRIRDEAHRFAITGHRRKRAKRYNESILETIPGLSPAKRRQLLKTFQADCRGCCSRRRGFRKGRRNRGGPRAKAPLITCHPGD